MSTRRLSDDQLTPEQLAAREARRARRQRSREQEPEDAPEPMVEATPVIEEMPEPEEAPRAGKITTFNITASRDEKVATYYDRKGEKREMGVVSIDQFDNDRVKRQRFFPADGNPMAMAKKKDAGFNLGLAGGRFEFINPADAQEVLLERGWQIKDVYGVYGGANLVTTFVHPEHHWDDIIDYDKQFWFEIHYGDEEKRNQAQMIQASIQLSTCLTHGYMGARYTPGLFRTRCTNGMVTDFFKFDTSHFQHGKWNPAVAGTFVDNLHLSDEVPTGPRLATVSTLQRAKDVLERYKSVRKDKSATDDFEVINDQFTAFRPDIMSDGLFQAYLNQLDLIMTAKWEEDVQGRAPVNTIELINAYTNAVNSRRQAGKDLNKGAWAALNLTDSVVKQTSRLAAFSTMFN